MHEGRPPSVTTFIHFCAPATVAKRSCPDFSMHAAVARSAFWFRWMNALAAVGRPCKTVAKRNFHTPGWVFGGFGGSIAPNCGETRILSSKSCPAQSTRRFNAQHMEHGTMNVAATLCFRSRSYIVSRVFKVAPVLDVSIVIQCGISVVLQFSSQQLCFASARWLRAVYWTFQVWFNVVSTLCSAIQQLRECYIVFCICKLAPRGRFKCDLMWYFQCALHPRLRTLYWTFQERKHTKNTNATYTHTHLSLWGRDLFYVTLWRAESVWPLSILLRQQQPSKKGWFEQMLDCVQCRTHVLNTHALSWSKLLDYSNLLFYWLVLPRPPRLMTF